jgi:hypothetical protein
MRRRLSPYVPVAVALACVAAIAIGVFALRPRHSDWPAQKYDYKAQAQIMPGGVPLRPMDADIFAAIEKGNLSRKQLLDLFPDRPYHVQLSGNSAEHWIGFALIDLHRTGKWDERWELKKDGVNRYGLGNSDEAPAGVMFTLRAGYWIPH